MPNRVYSSEHWQYSDTESYLQIFKAGCEGKCEKVFVFAKAAVYKDFGFDKQKISREGVAKIMISRFLKGRFHARNTGISGYTLV